MHTYEQALDAGQVIVLDVAGDYFRLLDGTAAIDVQFTRHGSPFAESKGVLAGLWAKPRGGFGGVRITNGATPQTIKVGIAEGEAGYDRLQVSGGITIAGPVEVSNLPAQQGAFAQSQKTVTNASAQLLAANPARRYLYVQNNDAAGIVYITLDGTAATAAKGIKIMPGGSHELQGFVASGEIRAIGSIASNANVVAVEG